MKSIYTVNLIERARPQVAFVDRLLSKLFIPVLMVMIFLAVALDVFPQTSGQNLNQNEINQLSAAPTTADKIRPFKINFPQGLQHGANTMSAPNKPN